VCGLRPFNQKHEVSGATGNAVKVLDPFSAFAPGWPPFEVTLQTAGHQFSGRVGRPSRFTGARLLSALRPAGQPQALGRSQIQVRYGQFSSGCIDAHRTQFQSLGPRVVATTPRAR
jgi:hypothetical protein